jgi:hypothetical protein
MIRRRPGASRVARAASVDSHQGRVEYRKGPAGGRSHHIITFLRGTFDDRRLGPLLEDA